MKWIADADSCTSVVSRTGGGKARNLALLRRLHLPVPPWFVVTAGALDEFIRANSLQNAVRPGGDLPEFSRKVEDLFLSAPVPESVKDGICRKLEDLKLDKTFLAVRSSGLDEDSSENSFAGRFSSFLFQKGWDRIEWAMKKCWASGFSERVLNYRIERGLGLDNLRMGVVIQKMVRAESAGVAFSRHPIRVLNRDMILISSVWGLGEGLVGGGLESDDFEVNRVSREISRRIVRKQHAYHPGPKGGVVKGIVDSGLQRVPSLKDSQVLEVARLAEGIEESLGAPQDFEWAYEKGRLYIVQTRPITNLPPNAFYDPGVNGTRPTLWDNANIIESYSGVTTPLTFSFASRAYHQVYVQFCRLMGVPEKIIEEREDLFRNMLGLIRGRVYYNLVNWYQLVLMLPGSSNNRAFMETMMGIKQQVGPEMAGLFDAVKSPQKYSPVARARLFCRTVMHFLRINTIVSSFRHHFDNVYRDARKIDFKSLSLPEQVDYYHHLEKHLLKQWKAPIINDYLCMVFFGLLKKLSEAWLDPKKEALESLQNDLLCGEGDIESTEPTKFLMRVAEKIDRGEPSFRRWFLSTRPDRVWRELRTSRRSSDIAGLLDEFLERFGFRCVNELKLEEPDLHDDPTFVIDSVANYIRASSYSVSGMEKRECEIRARAEIKVNDKVSGLRRMIYYRVLGQARKAVRNRENLRFLRTKVFGISRHLFRAVGSNLALLGIIENEEDVFYLTVDEIIAFVEGRALQVDLKNLVSLRRKTFEEFRKTPAPPDRFMTRGAAGVAFEYPSVLAEGDLAGDEGGGIDPRVLKGTPCCPGVAEGTVRVVEDLKDAADLNGEILVTASTDPGWVILYPSCSGLAIERGSVLSHSAVVARELGIPTIVGVSGGLMKRLKTGDRVRLDGSRGELRILE